VNISEHDGNPYYSSGKTNKGCILGYVGPLLVPKQGGCLPLRRNVILTSYRWRLQWQISKYAYKVHGIWGELCI
jgi:hypothetical protein